ncbi:transposase [Vagococcus elongatus]|uniref:Transposase IS204/IS1001/IS1096/IS1165 DDE domain-containing protein n=1 Tax=Vagococcus elongatus TaxID=180344 RepID=A0A430ASG6_9ENTE|nr:hypothetical protein CBF29_08465 [Vagococcus elongatus]
MPKATLIIDCFHVIKHLKDAFNHLRVKEIKHWKVSHHEEKSGKLMGAFTMLIEKQTNR